MAVRADGAHDMLWPRSPFSCVYEAQFSIDTALRLESKYFGQLLAGPVSRNQVRTMFVNKVLADKLSRRSASVPKTQVRKLGILGSGMMGAGIAHGAAVAGIETVLLDTTLELAEKGKAHAQQVLAKDVQRGKRTQVDVDAVLARIRTTTSYAELAGCDLVVEAVFEKREIKSTVTQAAEAVLGTDAVFASNTSTLPISGLAQASKRPPQFIGIHFFSPVDKMPLVEIIVGRKTAEATVARALDFVGQLRKTPIVVNDSRGFYTSRCFGTFVNEGMQMLQEGVAPALIENAAKMAGMAVGPLAVEDEVTIELTWKVIQQSAADLGSRYQQPPGYAVVETMVERLRRPGRRFGAGFYEYPAGAKKFLWPGLAEAFPVAPEQPSLAEARRRLMHIRRSRPRDVWRRGVDVGGEADLGSILGWGFPAWTGWHAVLYRHDPGSTCSLPSATASPGSTASASDPRSGCASARLAASGSTAGYRPGRPETPLASAAGTRVTGARPAVRPVDTLRCHAIAGVMQPQVARMMARLVARIGGPRRGGHGRSRHRCSAANRSTAAVRPLKLARGATRSSLPSGGIWPDTEYVERRPRREQRRVGETAPQTQAPYRRRHTAARRR
jgi:3-hydroxyacyl-CoA dehydrogenase